MKPIHMPKVNKEEDLHKARLKMNPDFYARLVERSKERSMELAKILFPDSGMVDEPTPLVPSDE